jgi:ketosteroid isomerase-like protein
MSRYQPSITALGTPRIRTGIVAALSSVWLLAAAGGAGAADTATANPASDLRATEVAFAATMADRDLEAFGTFLDDEVVFFTGDEVLRGRDAVMAAWAPYFTDPAAPFDWAPEAVEVLDSGDLGFSSGPVLVADGRRVGTFNSVWRRSEDGWKIVFDRGCPPCAKPPGDPEP